MQSRPPKPLRHLGCLRGGMSVTGPRHTFASLLVSGGMSLPIIGKLLGHTQVQNSQGCAHLFNDPLRAGLEAASEALKPKLRMSLRRLRQHPYLP